MAKAKAKNEDLPLEGGKVNAPDHATAAQEIKDFFTRWERLMDNQAEVKVQIKEVFAEAKARGYSVEMLRKAFVIAATRDKDTLAENEALLDIYRDALGV